MAREDDLESFRKTWKNELSKKNTDNPENQSKRGDTYIESKYPENNALLCHQPSPTSTANCSRNQNTGPSHSQSHSQEKWYYPFGIVGNLLEKSNTHKSNVSSSDSNQIEKESHVTSNVDVSVPGISGRLQKRLYDSVKNSEQYTQFKKKKRVEDVFSDKTHKKEFPNKRILDMFIADLDEITEIPFFDISLPREVAVNIFKHLNMYDLCRCSQVSRSWRNLAEDELLWCDICHDLGFETESVTVEKLDWKYIVRENITRQRQIVTNWKNRTGRLTDLQYTQGGVLCSVQSADDVIVAGYTNGEVRMWNLFRNEDCVLQPPSTALVIDETAEGGTIPPFVEKVATSNKLVAASYKQGHVDIWRLSEGVKPVYTASDDRDKTSCLCVAKSSDTVFTTNGRAVNSYLCSKGDKSVQHNKISLDKTIQQIKLLEKANEDTMVVVATLNEVYLHQAGGASDNLKEITRTYQRIHCIDVMESPDTVAIGLNDMVNIHDLQTAKLSSVLHGNTASISCLDIANSPKQQLVTGSNDRKVRVYDLRTDMPVMTLSGHTSAIATSQMDDWKVVSGDFGGFVKVWDQRMGTKLWELHNRHPVQYCYFDNTRLILGHVPVDKLAGFCEYDNIAARRHRGSVHVYDFSVDQLTQGVPSICLSTYDEPEAYDYNIRLTMPYDKLWA